MYCNKCGGINNDTSKFCVHCGCKLEKMVTSTAVQNIVLKKSHHDILILSAVIFVLVMICVFNITKVFSDTEKINPYNEQSIANGTYVYETKDYYYYYSDSLVRMNKKNNTLNIIDENANIIALDEDSVYFTDENGVMYNIEDNKTKPEEVEDIPFEVNNVLFDSFDGAVESHIYDKFTYVVYNDGSIIKKINSVHNKYINCTIYKGMSGDTLLKSSVYKGYMYLLVERTYEGFDPSDYQPTCLIKVSLSTGKSEVISMNTMQSFKFCADNIVYYYPECYFEIMDLNGENKQTLVDDLYGKKLSYICSGSNVFYSLYDEDEDEDEDKSYYKYNVKDKQTTSVSHDYTSFAELSDGFAEINNGLLVTYDENGKMK